MSNWSAAIPTGRYQSRAEAKMAAHLDLLKAAGEIAHWVYIGCTAGYDLWAAVVKHVGGAVIVGTYRPDFLVDRSPGDSVVVEVKGRVSRDFPLRRRLFEACYPDVPLHVVPSDQVEDYDPRKWRNGRRRRTR